MQYTAVEIEDLKQHNYLLGIAAGWEQVAKQLREQAASSYMKDFDSEAALLRSYAQQAESVSRLRREDMVAHHEGRED